MPELFSQLEFNKGIERIMQCLHEANRYFTQAKPWQLVKDPSSLDRLQTVLSLSIETLRLCGLLLQPIIPEAADKILNRIGIAATARNIEFIKYCLGELQVFDRSYGTSRKLGDDTVVLFRKFRNKAQHWYMQQTIRQCVIWPISAHVLLTII